VNAVTSASWVPLLPPTWGLPGATVLVRWETLNIKVSDLAHLGFSYAGPSFLQEPIEEVPALRVEHLASDPGAMILFKASLGRSVALDKHGLFRMPVAARPGGWKWKVDATLDTSEPDARTFLARFQQATHEQRGVFLLTGDLEAYWTQVYDGEQPTLDDVRTKDSWVAWLPLGDYQAAAAEAALTPMRRLLRKLAR
jgi:hypothetical protein